jgi:hypothetical protein
VAKVTRDPRDGQWLARWRDPAGRQRKKSFRRRVDAERFLVELQAETYRGRYVDPAAGKLLFRDYADKWLSGMGHLKATTAQRYREVARGHVVAQWGDWPLASIARSDVAAWIGELHGRGLSAGTTRKAYLVASMILEAAVEDGRLGRNPAKGVRLPAPDPAGAALHDRRASRTAGCCGRSARSGDTHLGPHRTAFR